MKKIAKYTIIPTATFGIKNIHNSLNKKHNSVLLIFYLFGNKQNPIEIFMDKVLYYSLWYYKRVCQNCRQKA